MSMPILPYNSPPIARLLANIEVRGPDECWPWRPTGRANRYALLNVRGRKFGAHRLMWQWFVGPIPDGLCVCHKCDDGYCLNPAHHFLGTHTENMRDKSEKGRCPKRNPSAQGELSRFSKLRKGQVLRIRARFDSGEPAESIAKDTGSAIKLIGMRERWSWIDD